MSKRTKQRKAKHMADQIRAAIAEVDASGAALTHAERRYRAEALRYLDQKYPALAEKPATD